MSLPAPVSLTFGRIPRFICLIFGTNADKGTKHDPLHSPKPAILPEKENGVVHFL